MRRHIDTAAPRTASARSETSVYPEVAFREFMINALCHRAFEMNTGSIRCAVFDDTIQITNPGTFPDGLELGDIGSGISVIRNPIISSSDWYYRRMLLGSWVCTACGLCSFVGKNRTCKFY
jgi:ATP-dependent DNA helicase RecG